MESRYYSSIVLIAIYLPIFQWVKFLDKTLFSEQQYINLTKYWKKGLDVDLTTLSRT